MDTELLARYIQLVKFDDALASAKRLRESAASNFQQHDELLNSLEALEPGAASVLDVDELIRLARRSMTDLECRRGPRHPPTAASPGRLRTAPVPSRPPARSIVEVLNNLPEELHDAFHERVLDLLRETHAQYMRLVSGEVDLRRAVLRPPVAAGEAPRRPAPGPGEAPVRAEIEALAGAIPSLDGATDDWPTGSLDGPTDDGPADPVDGPTESDGPGEAIARAWVERGEEIAAVVDQVQHIQAAFGTVPVEVLEGLLEAASLMAQAEALARAAGPAGGDGTVRGPGRRPHEESGGL